MVQNFCYFRQFSAEKTNIVIQIVQELAVPFSKNDDFCQFFRETILKIIKSAPDPAYSTKLIKEVFHTHPVLCT
jgi:hypothetical protein